MSSTLDSFYDEVDEIDGVPVRELVVDVGPGRKITIFHASDADRQLEDALEDDSADPYSAVLWPASLAVARELPGLVSPDDYVFDLGAGTGLAALTAASLGANVTAYDHDPFSLRLIEEAARLQDLTVETIEFDLLSLEPLPPADLIILSDLFYDYDLADSLARRVVEQVRMGGRAIVGDPDRTATPAFLDYLAFCGVYGEYHTVSVDPPDESGYSIGIGIHVFGE